MGNVYDKGTPKSTLKQPFSVRSISLRESILTFSTEVQRTLFQVRIFLLFPFFGTILGQFDQNYHA